MFLVEQAHWYYEDHVREPPPPPSPPRPPYRGYPLRDFAALVFSGSPQLRHYAPSVDVILERFRAFKQSVPVMGAVLLDARMDRVLLVRGVGSGSGWGFPRGKVNQGEADAACAAREVLEETGIDIEGRVVEEDHVELTIAGKRHKLFIVPGLDPAAAHFAPKCKGEIGAYAWHSLADLPATKEEAGQTYVSDDGVRHKFFMVWPFVKPLRRWVRRKGGGGAAGGQQGAGAGAGAGAGGAAAAAAAAAAARFEEQEEDLWDMPGAASGGGGGAGGAPDASFVQPPPPLPPPPPQQQPVASAPAGMTTAAAAAAAAAPAPAAAAAAWLFAMQAPVLPPVPVPPIRFSFDRAAIMQALEG